MDPVRLFVSGLPSGVSPDELAARFTPFGRVLDCCLAAPKRYTCPGQEQQFDRHFAHVTLEPTGEDAVQRCLRAYSGVKWRGSVMRCALARPSGCEQLKAERSADAGAGDSADLVRLARQGRC